MEVGRITQLTIGDVYHQHLKLNQPSRFNGEKKEYVLGFAFSHDRKKVLLIEKRRPEWMALKLNGIGGKIEMIDHSPVHGMCREFWEECGINTSTHDWEQFMTVNGRNYHICVYRSFMDIENFETKTDERIILKEVKDIRSSDELVMVSNLRWMIEAALDENYGNPFHLTSTYH